MEIGEVSNAEFEGVIPDSDNYEGKINHIEIPHERTRHPDEALTEEEHAISRSEFLLRVARIGSPDATHDSSAVEQTFSGGG